MSFLPAYINVFGYPFDYYLIFYSDLSKILVFRKLYVYGVG